ncbi:MAG: hypothetical protein MJZ32_04990 [Bacteroidaceae bacterium]|nr:hypothetical protein [Bacteroidaceae bacterium]
MGILSSILNPITGADDRKRKESEFKDLLQEYQQEGEDLSFDALRLYHLRKESVYQIMRVKQYVRELKNCDEILVMGIDRAHAYAKDFSQSMKWEVEGKDRIKLSSKHSSGKASMDPTDAMAIATTFGTATGVAIASLGGVAATNATLALLGEGALAVGSGVAGGSALLALAGPIGWGIAGVTMIGTSFFAKASNEKAIRELDSLISEINKKLEILRPKHKKLKKMISNTRKMNREVNLDIFLNVPNDYQNEAYPHEALAQVVNKCKTLGKMLNEVVLMA